MVAEMDEKLELYEDIYKKKFSFGKNWQFFLKKLDNKKIELAKKSLTDFTKLKNFKDKTFIDIGCGSGLFSLCACLLNAEKVISIDVDENSVSCAKYLRNKFKINPEIWEIKTGSALDSDFLKNQGEFDIVYSWGVLHHTGYMWKALENVIPLIAKDGSLYLAIYNEFKGFPNSKTWAKIKKFYSNHGKIIRKIIEMGYISYYILGLLAHGKNPIKYIKNYGQKGARGMSFYRDAVDWLGGYPYEFASTKEIIDFYGGKNFKLITLKKAKREGCNQYLFQKND